MRGWERQIALTGNLKAIVSAQVRKGFAYIHNRWPDSAWLDIRGGGHAVRPWGC
jgi:hypothetical protein